MRNKSGDAELDEKLTRKEFIKNHIEYKRVVKKQSVVDREFRRVMKCEVEYVWKTGILKNSGK